MKKIRNKVEYTQGIMVPSDGKSGGLAMMWKECVDIRLKSCSNSHIDVEVHESSAPTPWKATGFYGHPDAALLLKHKQPQRREKKRFMFEAMWIREGKCREIVEGAWESGRVETMEGIMSRIKRCQDQLRKWNWMEFGNVNKLLRQIKGEATAIGNVG
ncbi:hypothetical protein SO802_006452 [Lithocarpus litseifolius]|uniref:Uncharacterized protein n=1 Tax=Lithocarpus litseifolius TaxID=425828 RepID=A0AAW2DMK1_9ROSI